MQYNTTIEPVDVPCAIMLSYSFALDMYNYFCFEFGEIKTSQLKLMTTTVSPSVLCLLKLEVSL